MRLLHVDNSGSLTSTDFTGKIIPPYAILSHTWGDDEFLFEDLVNNTGRSKGGYEKILFCGEQAAQDNLQYFWVDTCCIDKWNLRELSNAINSMFWWYRNSAKCYVFLTDVSASTTDAQLQSTWEEAFGKSRWFCRGWTLQELIAPTSVDFFSKERQRLGDKVSLEQQLHEITGIPVRALRGDPVGDFSVEERKTWMVGRETTEEEDMAYSLIGIFGVSMEFRYGEGKERALCRLEEEIGKVSTTPFILPFDQNTRFVGRESQLAELEEKLFLGASTTKVAITGPGGMGKTQLALELAYKVRQKYKSCLVFWVPANDMESLHQAYMKIAQRLSIPSWDDEKTDIKKLVRLYLSKESAGQWLLIFDNVDVAIWESTGSSEAVSLIEYLPSSNQGAIVFTTTDKKTAVTLASRHVVELPEMQQEIAQRMLERCLMSPTNEQEVVDLLLKELAYLPLAIVQVAAYVNVNNITLQQYLSLLAEQKEEFVGSTVGEYEKLIAKTWLISFQQIRRHNKLAADYLLFMACVDRNDIPLSLLPMASPREKGVEAVRILDAYSFVTRRTAESALDLHRLVHLSTRKWLQSQDLLSQHTQEAITRLLEVFPDNNYGNRSKWRRLLPHAKYALSSDLTGQENKARTELVEKCGIVLHSDGRFNDGEEYFQEVVKSRTKWLGAEHPLTLISIGNLAVIYSNQGRWNEAENLEVQVLETSTRVLGVEHLSTLKCIINLALTYSNQGRWNEAEDLEIQLLETSTRVLGAEHPLTLYSINSLASTYWNQGRWKEAEKLGVQVVEIRKRVLGAEHLDTLTSIGNLALTYIDQGRWKEAEKLGVQVVEIRKRVLGAEHLDTLKCISNLAPTYWNQGRWKEARELEEQVLETSTRVLGVEHPFTLTSMGNLASTYTDQGRYTEAEELEVQVLETRTIVLGTEHPDTLISMNNLAFTWKAQGRDTEAISLLSECAQLREQKLGADHPDTKSTFRHLKNWQNRTT